MSANFKTTLETRRESMNQQRDRRNQFNGQSAVQNQNQEINLRSSVLYNDDKRAQESRKFYEIHFFYLSVPSSAHFTSLNYGC